MSTTLQLVIKLFYYVRKHFNPYGHKLNFQNDIMGLC